MLPVSVEKKVICHRCTAYKYLMSNVICRIVLLSCRFQRGIVVERSMISNALSPITTTTTLDICVAGVSETEMELSAVELFIN